MLEYRAWDDAQVDLRLAKQRLFRRNDDVTCHGELTAPALYGGSMHTTGTVTSYH